VLEQHKTSNVRVFAAWQPMLPTDWSAPSRSVLGRLPDPRVRQYWDPNHLLAKQMAQDARPPQPEQDCCVRSDILWDLAAVYPPGAAWSERMPPAIVFNGPVVDIVKDIEAALVSKRTGSLAVPGGSRRPAAAAEPIAAALAPSASAVGSF
jgi:hypothetical protein